MASRSWSRRFLARFNEAIMVEAMGSGGSTLFALPTMTVDIHTNDECVGVGGAPSRWCRHGFAHLAGKAGRNKVWMGRSSYGTQSLFSTGHYIQAYEVNNCDLLGPGGGARIRARPLSVGGAVRRESGIVPRWQRVQRPAQSHVATEIHHPRATYMTHVLSARRRDIR